MINYTTTDYGLPVGITIGPRPFRDDPPGREWMTIRAIPVINDVTGKAPWSAFKPIAPEHMASVVAAVRDFDGRAGWTLACTKPPAAWMVESNGMGMISLIRDRKTT